MLFWDISLCPCRMITENYSGKCHRPVTNFQDTKSSPFSLLLPFSSFIVGKYELKLYSSAGFIRVLKNHESP